MLCPAEDVKRYLEEDTAARVLYHPTLHHGAVLLWPGHADLVIKSWQQMLLDPAPPAVQAAADWHEPKPEEVHLHGTATPTAEQQQADVMKVRVLLDQDESDSVQHQQQLSNKQQHWQDKWRQQWDELQQQDSSAAADLLNPSNKASVAPVDGTHIAAVTNSVQVGSAACDCSKHQRGVSECPSYLSGDVGPLSDLHEESSLASDSPSAVSWAPSTDGSESYGGAQCEQCGSLIVLQQQGCSSQACWGSADDLSKPMQSLTAEQQQVTPGKQLQKEPGSSSCGQEELAVLCDSCCQEHWQQQVVQAMCA